MQAALKLRTTVLPGHRIEVAAPELPEGASVDLIVMMTEPAQTVDGTRPYTSMLDLVKSVAPGPRPFGTWEEYDRFLQEEKDSWER